MILLTGASGQVAGILKKILDAQGIPWRAVSQHWRLGENLTDADGVKIIINCAYHFKSDYDFERTNANLEGSKHLARWASSRKIRIINISTVLAEHQPNRYGQIKNLIEKTMRDEGHLNVRLGVINTPLKISLLASLEDTGDLLRCIPFPGLSIKVYETNYSHLEKLIYLIGTGNFDQIELTRFISSNKVKLKDLLPKTSKKGHRIYYLNINSKVALIGLRFLGLFGLNTNSLQQSLLGLISMN